MPTPVTLSLTAEQHGVLKRLLFPGDNREAVAFALCGQCAGDRRHRLMVREIYGVSFEHCENRSIDRITWSTEPLVPILEVAEEKGLAVVKFHSHPGGQSQFSKLDDQGDQRLLPMVQGWLETTSPVGSVVMLPDGQLFGRAYTSGDTMVPLSVISVVGDDISFWYPDSEATSPRDFCASHAQLFGQGTTERLRQLSVAVVGCSGTGSPTIEQLARLGVGELVLVDDDGLEERNINRVYNSTLEDAQQGRMKVDVLAEAVLRFGLGTKVISIPANVWSLKAIHAVAQCDVVIGCMDSVDGRYLLNLLAAYYTIPYLDVGVRLVAQPNGPRKGRIREVCGSVHYLQPGRSSLVSREAISMEKVTAAGLRRTDPEAYDQQMGEGYILGAEEHRPAVISVNSFAASLVVNELLARIHPYREERNDCYAQVQFSLSSMEFINEPEGASDARLQGKVGAGDVIPPLGLPALSRVEGDNT